MEWSLKNNKSDIFNLGTSQGFSVKEVLDKSIETLKIDINYQIGPRRPGDPGKLFSKNEKHLWYHNHFQKYKMFLINLVLM